MHTVRLAVDGARRGWNVVVHHRFAALFAGAGALLAVVAAGTSMLVLDGSSSGPDSSRTVAECAGPLTVTHPAERAGRHNHHITTVHVQGDMTACLGQTMLVEVDLTGAAQAYAVHVFDGTETHLTFVFDAAAGDFYDTDPTSVDGSLTVAGARLDPIAATDFGLVTVTIAAVWS